MTNEQARAYAIVAMKGLDYSMEQIERVSFTMEGQMDWLTEEEVEKLAKGNLK